MNDDLTRRYPMAVKPHRWESESSYTQRLLAANFETAAHQKHLLRIASKHDPNLTWTAILQAKAGRPLHLGPGPDTPTIETDAVHRCDNCPETGHLRTMCMLCTKGIHVSQSAPFANPVCIRHARWVGTGSAWSTQHPVEPATLRAAIRFDRLRRQGRMTRHLFTVLSASAGDPSSALPTLVAVAAALTTTPFMQRMFAPGSSYQHAFAVLTATITGAYGEDHPALTRKVWSYLRPTYWALRHAAVTGSRYEPAWEHDFALPADVADAYVAAHTVVPFSSYLAAGAMTLTDAPGIRRDGRTICEHGHQHTAHGACPVCNHTAVATGYNDLATTHPTIARELDPIMNGAATPATIPSASHRSLAWRCPRAGHVYWASPSNRTQAGMNCGICSNRTIVPGINDLTTTHPHLAAEIDPDYATRHPPTKMCAGSSDKPEWRCPDCNHRYKMSLYNRSKGAGCEPCRRARLRANRSSLAATHPDIAAQWHPSRNNGKDPNDYSSGSNETVWWLCTSPAAHWYQQRIDRKVAGYGCSICSRRKLVIRINDLATTDPLLVTEFHPYLNGSKQPDRMLAGTDLYWWRCGNGHVTKQSVPNRRKSHGCTECIPEDRILTNN